jgi:hypothetical protein
LVRRIKDPARCRGGRAGLKPKALGPNSHKYTSAGFAGSEGKTITTTPEHPFYTFILGWQLAGDLTVGTKVRQSDGRYGEVTDKEIINQPQQMYNLTVDQAHTFYVGERNLLVHNSCGVSEWEVGIYKVLNKKSNVGDLYQIHHAPQFQPAGQVIPGYSYRNAPAIVLRNEVHFEINRLNLQGPYGQTTQELFSKTLADLRSVGAPESALTQLQELWRSSWPNLFR